MKNILEEKFEKYHKRGFITDDPISVPHLFSKKQDIEIAGLFAASIAWGQRKTILKNALRIMNFMDNAPHDFVLSHEPKDLEKMLVFVHRTFNATDLLYFIHFLQFYYQKNDSLEDLFLPTEGSLTVESGLINFHNQFFSLPDFPARTRKHVPTPALKSACKRLCMYLRWMVRQNSEVDFGIWHKIQPSQLVCPLDVHVERHARAFGLLQRKQSDWRAAVELTENLKKFDDKDPVKYDFALFGMGVDKM